MFELKLERSVAAGIPEIKWTKKFWDKTARVVEGSTLENIASQKTRKGGHLKKNATSTRLRKADAGRRQMSLVDEEHRFVKGKRQSWKILKYLPKGKGIVVGGATAELRKLVGYVTKLGYVGWLGLAPDGVAAVRALMRKEVKDMFRRAKNKARGGRK